MKKRKRIWAAGAVLALVGTAWAASEFRQVQVREVVLRDKPSALGKVVGKLKYGDKVEVVTQSGKAWSEVAAEGLSGWVHASALTERKLKLDAGGKAANVTASGEEIALAGKGMAAAEKEYRSQNADLGEAFTFIDKMESEPLYRVSGDELTAFLEDGGVMPKEGGK